MANSTNDHARKSPLKPLLHVAPFVVHEPEPDGWCSISLDGKPLLRCAQDIAINTAVLWANFARCRCGKMVELVRWGFAVPTCYECLPPPPALPVLEVSRG